jgi:hypothetical protein
MTMTGERLPKFQKRLMVAFLLATGLVLLLVVYQRLHGINLLRAELRDLEQQGESMDVNELAPTEVVDSNNAVVAMLLLSNRLDSVDGLLRSAPRLMALTSEGRLTNAFTAVEWGYEGRDSIGSERVPRTNDWTGFMADFAPQTNLLESVLEALSRSGFDTGHVVTDGFHNLPMQPYMVSRDVDKMLAVGFLYHVRQNDLRAAHRCLIGLFRLASGFENDHLLIGQLIRLAILERAFFAVWQAIQVPGWSDAELAEWFGYWGEWDLSGDMLNAARLERAMTVDDFKLLGGKAGTDEARHQRWERSWDEFGFGIGLERTKINEYVVVPLWYFIWQEQDCCRALDNWGRLIGLQKLAIAEGWREAQDQFHGRSGREVPDWARPVNEDLNWFDERRFLLSSFSLLDPEGQTRRTMAVEAMWRLAATVIAIRRFEQRHDRVPKNLRELIPSLMPSLPLDPMDKKTLRYRVTGQGWILYSVGENGTDDGGNFYLGKGAVPKSLREGADIVWPQSAEQ